MKKLLTILSALVLSIVLVGCQDTAETGTRQGITDTEIIIGNTAATSGAFAGVGVPFNTAMEVVFAEYNAKTTGRKIVLKHYDDEFNGEKGLALTKKLVEEDKVFALVGHFGTNTVQSTMDYLLTSGVPMVYGVTGVNSLYFENEVGNNILTVQPIYKTEGRVILARVLHESLFGANADAKLGASEKIYVLYSEDDAGQSIKAGIEVEAKSQKVESRVTYVPFNESNASSVVQSALAQKPGVIILSANQAPTTAAAKALREQASTIPVFTSYVNGVTAFTPAQVDAQTPLPFDVYANAWVDITDASKPGPTADMIGGDGTLAGWAFDLSFLAGFSNEYWEGFVKSMNSTTVQGAKELWANSYAMAGYIAAKTFVEILERVDLDTVTWESFIKAAEQAPIKLPMAGTIDWRNGQRIGLDSLSLNKMTYPTTGATFAKVRDVENLETINKK
ncbi:ABC transporter substrate-binding protein [Acholeplasma hippikon]|uniref:Receptor family ligand binding region n=1 Tax=Acholeplasma hippikon TaxID=264636 RepID=A0A449BJU9_9MOLU|nr:ABC transporter substrate-binding protein [Acholeplasma hippikon]VEU82718.1 Receptor family ligand binding region [Acholeplasma hippikon]